MFAIDKILQNIDVTKLLEHYGFNISSNNGGYTRSACKIHDGNNPTGFVMNTNTTLWFCHTGDCGGGDIFTLVQIMEKCTFQESVKWLSNFYDVDINNLELSDRKNDVRKELDRFVKAILGSRIRNFEEFKFDTTVHQVKKYRGFKEDTLDYFDVGFVKEIELEKNDGGKYSIFNRIVFPIFYKKELVGASLRRTKSSDSPKWSHQPLHIKTSDMLYNYDNTQGCLSVVVVEGIVDVLAFHEIGVVAVCTFGAHLSNRQYRLLLRIGADIVLAYDGDDAGRTATQKAIKLLKGKANISVIHFADEQDAANITREELLALYEQRKTY